MRQNETTRAGAIGERDSDPPGLKLWGLHNATAVPAAVHGPKFQRHVLSYLVNEMQDETFLQKVHNSIRPLGALLLKGGLKAKWRIGMQLHGLDKTLPDTYII